MKCITPLVFKQLSQARKSYQNGTFRAQLKEALNELRHSTFVPPANALDHGKFVYRKRGSAAKHCRVALESVEASCGKELAVGEAITQLADEPGLKKRTWNGFDGPASACHKTGREEQEDEY
uniref:Uncharacterized protein n=1 Tax=Caenorhabditis japonica TaxID=281687 RepID=A0A2Q4TGZ2_CAEJA